MYGWFCSHSAAAASGDSASAASAASFSNSEDCGDREADFQFTHVCSEG